MERLAVLRARARMVSHLQAGLYADIAAVEEAAGAVVGGDPELTADAAAAEVRAALRLTRRAADMELDLALDLRRRLPDLWEALRSGRVDLRRARVLVDGTCHLSESAARAVIAELLEAAGRCTTGQLSARVARACFEVEPESAARRYDEAVDERRVVTEATDRGTGNLLALDLPADRLAAVSRRISRMARSLSSVAGPRSLDQLRSRAGWRRRRLSTSQRVDMSTSSNPRPELSRELDVPATTGLHGIDSLTGRLVTG